MVGISSAIPTRQKPMVRHHMRQLHISHLMFISHSISDHLPALARLNFIADVV